jgi:hypothetical protein
VAKTLADAPEIQKDLRIKVGHEIHLRTTTKVGRANSHQKDMAPHLESHHSTDTTTLQLTGEEVHLPTLGTTEADSPDAECSPSEVIHINLEAFKETITVVTTEAQVTEAQSEEGQEDPLKEVIFSQLEEKVAGIAVTKQDANQGHVGPWEWNAMDAGD